MTPQQVAQLIAYIDSRLGRVAQRTPLMVEAWHEDLAGIPYEEAKAAARRLTSVPDVITVHIGHLLADMRDAHRGSDEELDQVLEMCKHYYRLTDDCTTAPARDDYSLAARVYRRAGGFTALHHPQWHVKRLTDAYREIVAEDTHRALVNPQHAIEAPAHDWASIIPTHALTTH